MVEAGARARGKNRLVQELVQGLEARIGSGARAGGKVQELEAGARAGARGKNS